MIKLVRFSPVMFFIFMMSGIIAVIAAYVPNYEKKLYEKTSDDTTIVGYPAGDNIPVVTSVEDIDKYDVFTVYIKGEDIKQSGIYKRNDISTKGFYTSGKNSEHTEIDRIFDNIEEVSYSEYCVLTLPSNEKIIAFIDIDLLDIERDEYITLPIGMKKAATSTNLFTSLKERSELNDENAKWYVDMTGTEWRQNVLGDNISKKRDNTLVITFFLSLIAITFILYKYAEVKLGDKLED